MFNFYEWLYPGRVSRHWHIIIPGKLSIYRKIGKTGLSSPAPYYFSNNSASRCAPQFTVSTSNLPSLYFT